MPHAATRTRISPAPGAGSSTSAWRSGLVSIGAGVVSIEAFIFGISLRERSSVERGREAFHAFADLALRQRSVAQQNPASFGWSQEERGNRADTDAASRGAARDRGDRPAVPATQPNQHVQ